MTTPTALLRLAFIALCAFAFTVPLSACKTKPSKESCEKAIDHMRKIRGTEGVQTGADRGRAVRSCQGNSRRDTVNCFIAAKTVEDLVACEGETGKKYLEAEKKASDELDEKKEKDTAKKEAEEKKDGEDGE